MKKMILMIMITAFIMPTVADAQLSKVWEYVVPGNVNPFYDYNFLFTNQGEIIFTTVLGQVYQNHIAFGKLNKNGTEDWYYELAFSDVDACVGRTIGNNNMIYLVDESITWGPDKYPSSIEHSLFTYSETGNLVSTTVLNHSSYVNLGDHLAGSDFKVSKTGETVSITSPVWEIDCPDSGVYNGSATYAINYYNYNNGTYIWEDGQPKEEFISRHAVMSKFTSDGSIIILESLLDRTGNNCPHDPLIEDPYSIYIKRYGSNGTLLWEATVPQPIGRIICQTDDLVIIGSYGSWADQRITAYSIQNGAVVWTYAMTGNHVPVNAAIYNDKMLLQVSATDSNDRTVTYFYLFDITTGTVLRTMLFNYNRLNNLDTNWFDKEGNIYFIYVNYAPGGGEYGIVKYDQYFNELWKVPIEPSSMRIVGIDELDNIYIIARANPNNTESYKIMKYTQGTTLTLKDANKDALSDKEFYLIRVADDAPLFTPDTLGIVKTDADGKIQLTPKP